MVLLGYDNKLEVTSDTPVALLDLSDWPEGFWSIRVSFASWTLTGGQDTFYQSEWLKVEGGVMTSSFSEAGDSGLNGLFTLDTANKKIMFTRSGNASLDNLTVSIDGWIVA